MKRRGALGALAGWVVVGVLVFSGTSAFGQAEDIYENIGGLTWNGSIGVGGAVVPVQGGAILPTGFSMAGPTHNPNGIGQYLIGSYYDVRPVNGDAQVVNIAIVNTNSNNDNLNTCTIVDVLQGRDGENCFFDQSPQSGLPKGGILAKVRFRESRYSEEILDFNIALSCGEVWTGRLELAGDFPQLVTEMPVVTNASGNFGGGGTLRTSIVGPLQTRFGGGAPTNLTPADAQRGYIEVIGIADLPCEPNEGVIDLQNGNIWTILPNTFMATNALAAEAFIVRAASGVSFAYPFDAISRYRPVLLSTPNGNGGANLPYVQGPPSISLDRIFANDAPDVNDCLGFNLNGVPYTGSPQCVRQFNLALKLGRLVGQYDISPGTAGKTNYVITLPTKYVNCNVSANGLVLSKVYPQTSFQCIRDPGEEVTCTVYDRLENLAEGGFTSPSETERCFLPREVTILGLPGSMNTDDILPVPSTAQTPAGWVAIQLDDDIAGNVLHREIFPDSNTHDILGGRVQGYRGLPAIGLRLQQYENGNVGGTYGAIVRMQGDDPVLFIGQS